jgi:hypothetical protein
VRDVAVEDPNTLKFSERGGLIYMYNESMWWNGKENHESLII